MNVIHFVNVVHEFVPHARRREDKTEALLDAAMGLLAREGLEAMTLQRVARELGLVTTAIYRYFPSKDALLAALQRRAVRAIHAHFTGVLGALERRLSGLRLSPETAALAPILAAARAYVQLPRSQPEAFRLVAVLLGDPRPLIADEEALRTAPLVAAFLADVHALFERAVAARALGREHGPERRTLILWSTLHGLTQLEKLRRLSPDSPDAESLADAAASALLRGFGAEPLHVTRALRALHDAPATRTGAQES